MAEINVTPLVDVMLVLLIIFMVTAPLLKAGVPVQLPDSRARALAEDAHAIDITIDRAGAIYLDGDPVLAADLPRRLATIPYERDGKPPAVTLRADRAFTWGPAMAVLGELNRAGFKSIALVTNVSGTAPR